MAVRRVIPYHESPDFEATRAFYTQGFFVRDPHGVVISVLAHE
jgi:hypothetical protein